jgi:beta-glucosidase
VVQLYVQDVVASVTRPIQQLAGFARVELGRGEARRVRFRVDASQLGFHDRAMRFVVEPGEFRVALGASSEDIRLEGRFSYEGATLAIDPREIRPTSVQIE